MVIANTKAKSVYNANGVTREWQIGFDFDANVSKLTLSYLLSRVCLVATTMIRKKSIVDLLDL